MFEFEFEELGLEPEVFNRHLPKYADFLGLLVSQAARQIIEEASVLQHIKVINNKDLEASGTAFKAMLIFSEMARSNNKSLDGESMIVVGDNFHYRKDEYYEDLGIDPDLHPKAYLHVAEDNPGDFFGRRRRTPYSVSVGRPNNSSHLVVRDPFTPDDYDTVAECVTRLVEAKQAGELPNYSLSLNSLSIWGNLEFRRPDHVHCLPMEYTQVVE